MVSGGGTGEEPTTWELEYRARALVEAEGSGLRMLLVVEEAWLPTRGLESFWGARRGRSVEEVFPMTLTTRRAGYGSDNGKRET
jgi:hypothetical protein